MNEEEKKDIQDELGKAKAMLVLKNSEGGKMLVDSIKSDIESIVGSIVANYRTASHTELISWAASLEAKRSLLHKISASEESVDILKEELNTKKVK